MTATKILILINVSSCEPLHLCINTEMMEMDNNNLVDELLALTDKSTETARRIKQLGTTELNFRAAPGKWTILECVEHLNRYGDFYLPAIERAMLSGQGNTPSRPFRSGMIGNYFANLMKVKDGSVVKMKTPADKNPLGAPLPVTTVDRFLKQQEMLSGLLRQARHADLTNIKVPISLTRLIRLRLGDTFRFFVFHIERHMLQAENIMRVQGIAGHEG